VPEAAPQAVLDDLHDRLVRARLPGAIEGIGWEQGTDREYLSGLIEHWRERYDWRGCEARFAAHDEHSIIIDGQRFHAVVARSPHADALPLLLVHGWPGSVAEFLDVLGPLTDPTAHGGDASDAFHVVAPSLPGFGFSGPTHERGWHPRRIADACISLMADLGFDRYGVQGGDWGSIVGANVADLVPDRVAGLHLNFVTVPRAKDGPPPTEAEQEALVRLAEWRTDGAAYQEIQATRPQTLGYALEDSPVGLCAWIIEKFRAWSDCGGDLERSFTRDRLLDNITLYWVTGTAASSCRIYWEMRRVGRGAIPHAFVSVPTGIANFPGEVTSLPRAWIERRYNVVHWTTPPRGGHFAAMEVPELFVEDVRAFFRLVR
jgi:pimeloyl-ACP methyl ester carboxylesterase